MCHGRLAIDSVGQGVGSRLRTIEISGDTGSAVLVRNHCVEVITSKKRIASITNTRGIIPILVSGKSLIRLVVQVESTNGIYLLALLVRQQEPKQKVEKDHQTRLTFTPRIDDAIT